MSNQSHTIYALALLIAVAMLAAAFLSLREVRLTPTASQEPFSMDTDIHKSDPLGKRLSELNSYIAHNKRKENFFRKTTL
jgi:hypothetical protein